MKRVLAMAVLLVLMAFAAAAASDEPAPKAPPDPKLTDVRAWYRAPGQKGWTTVLWWQPDKVRLHRPVPVRRNGTFRVRVLVSGGIFEDEKGLMNWVSVVFRDDNSTMYDLPHEQRQTYNGIKDITWRVPELFVDGPVELDVVAWNVDLRPGQKYYRPVTPVSSLLVGMCDRTFYIKLGELRLGG